MHISSILKETSTIIFIQIGTLEDKEKIMCYLTLHQVLVNCVQHSSTRRYCWSCVDALCGLLLKFNVNKVMFSIIYTLSIVVKILCYTCFLKLYISCVVCILKKIKAFVAYYVQPWFFLLFFYYAHSITSMFCCELLNL